MMGGDECLGYLKVKSFNICVFCYGSKISRKKASRSNGLKKKVQNPKTDLLCLHLVLRREKIVCSEKKSNNYQRMINENENYVYIFI